MYTTDGDWGWDRKSGKPHPLTVENIVYGSTVEENIGSIYIA